MSVALLNGVRVISARIVTPWRGAWYADLDLDPEVAPIVPTSGPATLVIGAAPGPIATLVGTIDPRFSGAFVATVKLRMVGGGGGWDKLVPAQHFTDPGVLLDQIVYAATATAVGEIVVVPKPTNLGTDFGRAAGPASAVFLDAFWYVDPATGQTLVAPRLPATPDLSLEILSYDPISNRAELACDALVVPGTVLVDQRIPTAVVVRDVEQTFDGVGSRAVAWCQAPSSTSSSSRLAAIFTSLVRASAGTAHLKVYRYRVVLPAGDGTTQWALQAIERDAITGAAAPMPDLVPAKAWSGMAGVLAKLPPSLEVLVDFGGDATSPRIMGYSVDALPLEITADATLATHVAPTSPLVDVGKLATLIALGPLPVPLVLAPPMIAGIGALGVAATAGATGYAAIGAFASALAAAAALPTYAAFAPAVVTAAGTLASAMTAAAAAQTTGAAAMTTAAGAVPTVVVKGT